MALTVLAMTTEGLPFSKGTFVAWATIWSMSWPSIIRTSPAESLPALVQGLVAHDVDRRAADLQPVAVHEHQQVVQPVVAGCGRRLPVRSLGEFPVTHDDVDLGVDAVHLQAHGHAARDGQPVAERPGVGLDAGHLVHVRVPAQFRAVRPVGVQDALVQEPPFGQRRVEGQALVAGRKHKPVALRPVRALRVDPHDLEVEGGQNVGARQGTADVSGPAGSQHPQNIALRTRMAARSSSRFSAALISFPPSSPLFLVVPAYRDDPLDLGFRAAAGDVLRLHPDGDQGLGQLRPHHLGSQGHDVGIVALARRSVE